MRALVSITPREAPTLASLYLDGSSALTQFGLALSEAGLQVEDCCEATAGDMDELGSTWMKRLGIPRQRAAWLLTARKP